MKTVPLSQGYVAIVDDEDYDRVSRHKWQARVVRRRDGSELNVYAGLTVCRNGKRTQELLHRFIISVRDPAVELDHRDGNGLNCQKSNLRICTHAENSRNRRLKADNSLGLKGVHYCKDLGTFRARIMVGDKRKSLGQYATAELAARAYDFASEKYHGSYGLTNAALGLLKKRPAGITVQLPLQLLEAI
jgi:hypothetical protein